MGCPDSSESYKHAKKLQRRDVRELLEKFGRVLNWRSDGEDTVLDISCGSGDLTIDYILPILPKSFKRLVGTDPSEELIQQAQQQNGHPKVFFEQFDVGIDMQKQQLQYIQPADHIMSLHSLHWEQNHEQAVRNIYNLLKPNGDCLLLFVANSPVYEAWDQISQTKWGRYMTNSNPFMGMYQDSFDPADEFAQLFRLCDFSQYHVEVCEKTVTFGDSDCLKSKSTKPLCLHSINIIAVLNLFRLFERN